MLLICNLKRNFLSSKKQYIFIFCIVVAVVLVFFSMKYFYFVRKNFYYYYASLLIIYKTFQAYIIFSIYESNSFYKDYKTKIGILNYVSYTEYKKKVSEES